MSLEAEKNLIGCLILERDNIAKVVRILTKEMFTNAFLGEVFEEKRKAFEKNATSDEVEIARKLTTPKRTEQEIMVFLAEIVKGVRYIDNVEVYARIVVSDHKARKAAEIMRSVKLDGNVIDEQLRGLTESLQSLLTSNDGDNASLSEIASEYEDDYFKPREKPKITIGFKDFDDVINIGGGDIMAIGARPKTGKSALAMQIAVHLNDTGHRVGYFNLEMTKKQLFERLVAFLGELDLGRVLNGIRYLEGEKEKFDKAVARMKEMRNMIIFSGGKRVSDIRADIVGKNIDVAIIDYLQLLRPDGKRSNNRYAEVGDISRGIKAIAMDFNIPVIILSQLNRVSEMNKDKEPSSAEFRESGDIEQDVSTALILWQPDRNDSHKRMLKIDLNRQGLTRRSELYFEGKYMKFRESSSGDEFCDVGDDDIVFE